MLPHCFSSAVQMRTSCTLVCFYLTVKTGRGVVCSGIKYTHFCRIRDGGGVCIEIFYNFLLAIVCFFIINIKYH